MLARVVVVVATVAACGRFAFEVRDDGDPGDGSSTGDGDSTVGTGVYLGHSFPGSGADFYSVEVATGQLELVGSIGMASNEVSGLAYKDSNTLYASTVQGVLYRITLSPFSYETLMTGMGAFVGLEVDGDNLIGVDGGADSIVSFRVEPFSINSSFPVVDTVAMMPIDIDGGDLVHVADSEWDVWTNSAFALYRVDVSTGNGTLVGSPSTVQTYIVGMTEVDSVLYGISRDTDSIHVIDRATSQIGAGIPLCIRGLCPTSFNLELGDMTAAPPRGN